ncbi:uncharacterized protein LOC126595934 [Malus sylvestris]|uniref:uncharacterized protein LOC126595934 n=1 Tax=Malus sylvestris TaxID=3752 RepID=UPI0021AC580A|nr:uncharacterized protein LOC126595934 [Malus sylvestris]
MMAKHGLAMSSKIRESTRFYPYLKIRIDCIGAIDGTHIPASVSECDVSSYRNRKGVMTQNVLAAFNFDLEFMYVLSGWEGSAHDSRVLNDALTRKNGLKVPQDDESSSSPPLSVSEGDLDQDFQTQEQQRHIANEWSYNIALDMWRDAHNDNNVNGG